MTKPEFLLALGKCLSALPQADAEERLRFYSEMIEDRMEEGLSEEDAVAAVGSVEEIAAQILGENPHTAPKPRKFSGWQLTLLILGSPVWFSLLMAAFAVALSVFVSLWAVIVSLWAVFGSMAACAVAVPIGSIVLFVTGSSLSGIVLISGALICGGLAIFLFFGCKVLTGGAASLTKKLAGRLFHKKGAVA